MSNNFGAVIPPIHLSTIFAQKSPGKHTGFEYSRIGNPTREGLEKELAKLEKGKFALSFSSGTAAAATVLASLSSGSHILCSQDVYEGTFRLLQKVFKKFNVSFNFVDLSNIDEVEKSIKPNTKLIWFENLTNPLLKVINVKRIVRIAKKSKVLVLVDNTFATPVFRNPLTDGADIVLHSLTKFIGGHHDVTAGALVVNDQQLFENLNFLQHTIGATPSPFDCFLVLRGIKSLNVRMQQHKKNAKAVAQFLQSSKQIERVVFPGFSGIVSFWVKGSQKKTTQFLEKLKHIKITQSLGGPDTIVQHPRSMMTFSLSSKKLDKLGLTKNLIRMSVGLEEKGLIIKDIKQAILL